MPVYEYKGLAANGRQTKGSIEAESARAARSKLKSDGIFATDVTEQRVAAKKKGSVLNVSIDLGGKRVGTTQLAVSTRQLSTLIGAGMPAVEAIRALCDQVDNEILKSVFSLVGEEVNEGSTLANAMRKHPKAFPKLYVNMIASGEASGKLDLVLERLADLYENQAILKRKVYSALTYPILMLILCFGVVTLLLAYVVPQITAIFQDQGIALPLPTQIIITLSDLARSHWHFGIAGFAILVAVIRGYARSDAGRRKIDKTLLKLPIFGSFTLKIATSRFSRNLGTMLGSGIELLRALAIAKNIVGNVILEEAVDKAIEGVREGGSLAAELKNSKLFPPLLIHMTAVGERTGALEAMLLRAAKGYESEVDAFISGLTSILEPILIIILAGIVGVIIAAVMLPMLEMSALTGL
jgi:general secretion pathway protein F